MSRKLISNIISGTASKIAVILISIVSVPIHLGYWGVEQYGLYVTILSVLAFVPITSLGVGTSLAILSAKTPDFDTKVKLILQSFILMFATSVIAFIVVTFIYLETKVNFWEYIGLDSDLNPLVESLLYLLISAFVTSFFSVINGAFNGINRQDLDNWYSIPISLVSLVSIILTRYCSYGFVEFAIFSLVGNVLMNGFKLYHLTRFCNFDSVIFTRDSIFNLSELKQILRIGSRFLIFSVSVIVITNVDNILIAKYFDSSMVSSYSINLKLMNVIFGLVMVINLAILPLLGNCLGNGNYQRIKAMYNDSFYICIVLCSFLSVWLLSIGNDVIILWAGTDAVVSKSIFLSMLSFAFLYTIVNLHVTIASAMNFTKTLPFIGGGETVLNIVISLILLNYIGVLGIIIGSLIASFLVPSILHPIAIKKLSNNQVYIEKKLLLLSIAVIAPLFFVLLYLFLFDMCFHSKCFQLLLTNLYLIVGFYLIAPASIKTAFNKSIRRTSIRAKLP